MSPGATAAAGAITVGAAWRSLRDRLAGAGIDTASLDARLLAGRALGLDGLGIIGAEHTRVPTAGRRALDALAARRLAGEPVARILGEREFHGRAFALGPETLVPRPETELLVDLALELARHDPDLGFIDLGTGSGCIAISILAEAPDAAGVGTDLDAGALEVAAANARRHAVADRLDLRRGSWFEPFRWSERFELIVSNPPYIESDAIGRLPVEVARHDPRRALDGGADGLDAYRAIAAGAAAHLAPRGQVMVEIGSTQGSAVAALFAGAGFPSVETRRDLSGHDRVIIARR